MQIEIINDGKFFYLKGEKENEDPSEYNPTIAQHNKKPNQFPETVKFHRVTQQFILYNQTLLAPTK